MLAALARVPPLPSGVLERRSGFRLPMLDRRSGISVRRARELRVLVAVAGNAANLGGVAGEAGPPVKKGSGGGKRSKMLVELSPWQNKQLDSFWERQGVRNVRHREKLLKLATALLLFRTPGELEERISSLKSSVFRVSGIAGLDVGTMVGRFPQVLCGDVAFCVETKLPLLAKILPGVDVKRLIEKVPQVLSLDVGVTVLARCTDLIKLLPNCDILSMIEAQPQLLTVSVQRCVAPNWAALQWRLAREGVSLAAAERVVQAMPRLLATTPVTIDARVTLLEDLVPGLLRAYENSPSALARLMCASEPVLHRLGYIRETHPDLLKTAPRPGELAVPGGAAAEGEGAAGAGEAEEAAPSAEGGGGRGGKGTRGRSKALAPVTIVNRPEKAFREMFPGYGEWEERRMAALLKKQAAAAAAERAPEAPTEPPLLISDLFPAPPRSMQSVVLPPPDGAGERQGSSVWPAGVREAPGASSSASQLGDADGGTRHARGGSSAGRAGGPRTDVGFAPPPATAATKPPDRRWRDRGGDGRGSSGGGDGGRGTSAQGGGARSGRPSPPRARAGGGGGDPADRRRRSGSGGTGRQQQRRYGSAGPSTLSSSCFC